MSKHAPRGPVKAKTDLMDANHTMDGVVAVSLPYVPCAATSKQSGQRCKRRPIPGGAVCVMHGGKAPQVQASARERLMALQPLAIQTMHNLMNREEYPTVQLGAARDVLDRTEGKPIESVSLTGANNGPLIIEIRKPW